MQCVPTDRALSPKPLHILLNVSPGIKVVDIGANPIDEQAPYEPLRQAGHTRVVGFDPNPAAIVALDKAKGANDIYLPYAVGDGRRHTVRHCAVPGMTSLLEPNQSVLSLFWGFGEWGRVVRTEEVDTVRLDDVPETAGLDLLKIDIQGGEMMVFENAIERLKDVLVIQTEVEFLEMYIGQPLFSDIDVFLRRRGFVLHRLEPMYTRDILPLQFGMDPYSGHSQLLWADAIFVRDFTRLDVLDQEQLLKMAIIVHDCYRAHDLTLHILREYDRRTGTNYGDIFFAEATGASRL